MMRLILVLGIVLTVGVLTVIGLSSGDRPGGVLEPIPATGPLDGRTGVAAPELQGREARVEPGPVEPSPVEPAPLELDPLRARLRSASRGQVLAALREVEGAGPRAVGLVPELYALLADPDSDVVVDARRALVAMGAAAVKPLIRESVEPRNEMIPVDLSAWLGAFSTIGQPAVVPTAELLMREDTCETASLVLKVLARCGYDLAPAAATFRDVLRDAQDEEVLDCTVRCVRLFRDGDRAAFRGRLAELLWDRRRRVQLAAVVVLRSMGPAAADVVPELQALRLRVEPDDRALQNDVDSAIAKIQGQQ